MKQQKIITHQVRLDTMVGGGQAMGTLDDGRKAFVWGGLPGELVTIRQTKKKSRLIEGIVTKVHQASDERIAPRESESYLSTSPWQLMIFEAEQRHKAALIMEAFKLHNIELPGEVDIYSDGVEFKYRNKVEFSWYGDTATVERRGDALAERHLQPEQLTGAESLSIRGAKPSEAEVLRDATAVQAAETLDLAFYRRGSKGKIVIDGTALAKPEINQLARELRDLLTRKNVTARQLKTLLIRCDHAGSAVWQLYTKDKLPDLISPDEAKKLSAKGGEVIYSDPRSPASVITERLTTFGDVTLSDRILGRDFRYATEGFFQVNLPVYEQALRDMQQWVSGGQTNQPVLDLYAGVGSIGLTIGGPNTTLVEINPAAVAEMKRNIELHDSPARAVLAPAEQALDYIASDQIVIVDPPRAGLHADLVDQLLEVKPSRIIYLSCNPATQARDVALLEAGYKIVHHHGYNFFPRTPHIEHLIVLDALPSHDKP